MNEFDYEVMQRKRVANSARHRVNGVKSKKCSLPSDRMTPKQWKERNGKVMSYNLNQPMKWADFKTMPADIQKEYIENLMHKHAATGGAIAKMLGISPSAFSHYVTNAGLNVKFDKAARRTKEQKKIWQEFLGEAQQEPVKDEPVDVVELPVMEADIPVVTFEAEPVKPESQKPVTRKEQMRMNHFSLSFCGDINVEMVANSLRYIIGNGVNAELKIDCVMGA